jgi:voltage-gated sodium channel
MVARCKTLSDSPRFQNFILGTIIFNSLIMGVETSQAIMRSIGGVLIGLNILVQLIFICEISIRLAAYFPDLRRFFRDGWNTFDFIIIVGSLIPAAGPMATVARLSRLLRVMRLISALPELRLIVSTMLRSIPSMGNVILLLGLLLYVYAILGYHLFHDHDPQHWGTLGAAFMTLFQMLTLEGWVEVQAVSMQKYPFAWVYYYSYVVIAVFVVINLFIAIVINNLENTKKEEESRQTESDSSQSLLSQIASMRESLDRMETALRAQSQKEYSVPGQTGSNRRL